MPDELMDNKSQGLLIDKLVMSFLSIDGLNGWLRGNFLTALAGLEGGNLKQELATLFRWADSEDGLRNLLQKLADHPPAGDKELPGIIFGLTSGRIRAQSASNSGLPAPVRPHLNWFAADRPFVNREKLRDHLAELDHSSPGAQCILVIDGKDRTGKTFGMSLAFGCKNPQDVLPTIDFDKFAMCAAPITAHELARWIADDQADCPFYDPTKESEAVPRLKYWLTKKLKTKSLWIIVDHCNRHAATDGARSLLRELAEAIRNGELPRIRLILIDFDRNELPREWRDTVRYDCAGLPDLKQVKQWCQNLATAAKRKHSEKDAEQWATEVFSQLEKFNPEDGTWQIELERRLRHAVECIKACKELEGQ